MFHFTDKFSLSGWSYSPGVRNAHFRFPSVSPKRRLLKLSIYYTGRRQPEVKFTSDLHFPPTGSAVATLHRLCFAYFDLSCNKRVSLYDFSAFESFCLKCFVISDT